MWALTNTRLRLSAALAALACVLALPVAAASARPATDSAARALAQHGYRKVSDRCSAHRGRTVCDWHAVRSHSRCSGKLVLAGHHGQAKIENRRCRKVASRQDTAIPPVKSTATKTEAPPATGTTASVTPPVLGFNTYTSTRTIAEQREVGATVSRLFVDWAVVEPSQGQWDWTQPDSEYDQMVAGGLKPLIVAFTAPCWARPSTSCANSAYTGPPDAAYDQDWITYIHDLAVRYPQAAGIEVWNEPNLSTSFLPEPNPARYTQLLEEAYTTIKAVNPNLPVISGGLLLSPPVPGAGPITGGYGADQFLNAMYSDGAKKYMDALGVHIYPSDYVNGSPSAWDPNAMTTWMSELNAVRSEDGESSQPIWITEMGISTTTQAGWPAAATDTQQATDLSTMSKLAQANPSVRAVIIQGLEDQAAGYDDPYNAINEGWGIFTSTGAQKPSACAVSLAWHGTLSCG